MDFRILTLLVVIFSATACGPQKTASTTFQKAAEECVADVVPKQFIVQFKNGETKTVRAESTDEFLNGYATEHLGEIEFTEPDYYVHVEQSAIVNASAAIDNWGAQRVGVDQMWSAGIRGDGVTVAVIDSGMDVSHIQLKNQIAENPGEMGLDAKGADKSSNGIDDDGDGLVDDFAGYDFVNNQPLTKDHQYHGTHVAGIIAAAHSDTTAAPANHVQGLAPKAKILPLAFLNEKGNGLMSDGVRAINYAVQRGARVINASWGGPTCSKSLRDTIQGLAAKKVFFVSAAGNDSSNIDRYKEYPASIGAASQITVGATGDHDILAEYSNYGSQSVHIFAPGSDIVSTVPGDAAAALSGTSMATPFVSGAVALLLSAEPQATIDQLRKSLYLTAFKQAAYLNACQGRMDLRSTLAELRRQMGK